MKKIVVGMLLSFASYGSFAGGEPLQAFPERCVIEQGSSTCTSKLVIEQDAQSCLYVAPLSGGAEKLVGCGTSKSFGVNYISTGGFEFTLRAGTNKNDPVIAEQIVVGEIQPRFLPPEQLRGVTLSHILGEEQNVPYFVDMYYDNDKATYIDDPLCEKEMFKNNLNVNGIINEIENARVNWVKIPVRKADIDAYLKAEYKEGCRYEHDQNRVNPFVEANLPKAYGQFMTKLNFFASKLKQRDINVELVIAGDMQYPADVPFFESIIIGANKQVVKLFMLGEDVDPLRNTAHEDWLSSMYQHVYEHDNRGFRNLSYAFDTVAYRDAAEFKQYVTKVKSDYPKFAVVPAVIYPNYDTTYSGTHWRDFASQVKPYIDAFDDVGFHKMLWVDEYGMRIGRTNATIALEEADQWSFYSGFLAETRCFSGSMKDRMIPSIANHAGVDGESGYGLFKDIDQYGLVYFNNAWNAFSTYNHIDNGCP